MRTKPEVREREWLRILEAHGYACFYCGRDDVNMIREHVWPASRGGTDELENIVPSCTTCNCRKSDRTPLEWLLVKTGQWKQDPKTRAFRLVELKPGECWAWYPNFEQWVAVCRDHGDGTCRVRHSWNWQHDVYKSDLKLCLPEDTSDVGDWLWLAGGAA